ncbi:DUF2226 domain-containing protein [Methanocaldococcus sp.]
MIRVIEGNLIKSFNEKKDIEELKNIVRTGYIAIFHKTDKINEAYLFIEDGDIIGVYVKEDKEYFGDLKKFEDFYKNLERTFIIECYSYDKKDKINLMKWIYPEIFKLKIEEEKEDVKKKVVPSLNIDLDEPIVLNTSDYKPHIGNGKCIVYINKEILDSFERGYLFFDNKDLVGAIYINNFGVFFGEKAKKMIDNIKDGVISVFKSSEEQFEKIFKMYPDAKLEVKRIKKDKEEELEVLSRDELLKKLGIKEPDEKWVEEVIEEVFRPTTEELLEVQNEIRDSILKILSKYNEIENTNLDVKASWEQGRYIIDVYLDVYPKKVLGFIKKDIPIDRIKYEINNIIKEKIPSCRLKININIK